MSSIHTNPPRADGVHVFGAARAGLSRVGGACQTVVRIFQTAKMMQILCGLGDRQLAEIGIERCDIPSYAERLISSARTGGGDTLPGTGDVSRTDVSPEAAPATAEAIPPRPGDHGITRNARR